jgi:hypothetical protein
MKGGVGLGSLQPATDRGLVVQVFGTESSLQVLLFCGNDDVIDQIRDHEAPWGAHRRGGFRDPFGHVWLVGDKSPLEPFPRFEA